MKNIQPKINYRGKNRRSRGLLKPTVFIILEVSALLITLYIVNFGHTYTDWNILTVSATLLYFLSSSVTRYFKVITRD
ncbi:hypothetical protein SAMN06314019_10710 [Epsilonproteobacteria bacterium SCGC AD-311-C15]|jgi:hypothetical protein|nr:hypothetical protein SAMN06314019_10710 [Epsilonproteobacteria bacterium SCGC AD-311-C15]